MNKDLVKTVKIAKIVLDLSNDGVSTDILISALASAIDMLIEKDNLNHKEVWMRLYTTSRLINELS